MYIVVALTLPENKFILLYIAIALTLPERKFSHITVALTLPERKFSHITVTLTLQLHLYFQKENSDCCTLQLHLHFQKAIQSYYIKIHTTSNVHYTIIIWDIKIQNLTMLH